MERPKIDLDAVPNSVWEEFAELWEEMDKIHMLINAKDKRIHKLETKGSPE